MRVVVAEKPSVARDLARVLGATKRCEGYLEGSGLRITWCFGHMAELQEPAHYDPKWKRWNLATLPMIPERFEVKLRKGAKQQFQAIKKLLRSKETTDVVNACDAGREGELIFRYVYDLAGCKKPVRRLWISSLTDQAIQDGWSSLRSGQDFDTLADAARCRSEADWVVGLNATRALTLAAKSDLLSVGRVQTPTLAMIVERDDAIANFVPEDFWQVKAKFSVDAGEWTATWFRHHVKETRSQQGDEAPKSERLSSVTQAEAIVQACSGKQGVVELAERKQTRERPPLLYDLTALQRRANQRFGFSASRTLEIAQALYEKHKVLTYPRTDARYLTPDQVPGLTPVIKKLAAIGPYQQAAQGLLSKPIRPSKRVVNAAEVGDHHAILPTGRDPRSASLGVDEKRIYDLVARRLLAALSADALFDVTTLVTAVEPQEPLPEGLIKPLKFRARGRICTQEGWRAIDPPAAKKKAAPVFPSVQSGERAAVHQPKAVKGQTRPPKPHNDASLLRAMETAGRQLDEADLKRALRSCGLGTPATRAAILQTLIDRQYVVRQGRSLVATEKGSTMIRALPVEALKSAELTGRWEGRLAQIAAGEHTRTTFMADTCAYAASVVQSIVECPPQGLEVKREPRAAGESLGDCPACGKPVRDRKRVFACDTGRECSFVVFTTISGRQISSRMVKQLLKDGRSQVVKGFKSKAGKPFQAGLTWDQEKQRVVFYFPPRVRVGDSCPKCHTGKVIRGRTALGCSRWREGCTFKT